MPNKDKTAHAPTEYMVTQTIKADGNGVFTYAPPASTALTVMKYEKVATYVFRFPNPQVLYEAFLPTVECSGAFGLEFLQAL